MTALLKAIPPTTWPDVVGVAVILGFTAFTAWLFLR